MPSRSGPAVVVTYGHQAATPAFARPVSRSGKPPSIDSGVGLDDIAYSHKSQHVVVTVPRRRFARKTRAVERTIAAVESRCGRHSDFTLYPSSADLVKGGLQSAQRATPLPGGSGSRTERPKPEVAERLVHDNAPASVRQCPVEGLQPPQPRPARLPTPELPEVNESTWWGK